MKNAYMSVGIIIQRAEISERDCVLCVEPLDFLNGFLIHLIPHMLLRLCSLLDVVFCTWMGSVLVTTPEVSTTILVVVSGTFWLAGTSAAAFSGSTSEALGMRNIPASVKVQLSAQLIPEEPWRRKEIPLVNMAMILSLSPVLLTAYSSEIDKVAALLGSLNTSNLLSISILTAPSYNS